MMHGTAVTAASAPALDTDVSLTFDRHGRNQPPTQYAAVMGRLVFCSCVTNFLEIPRNAFHYSVIDRGTNDSMISGSCRLPVLE
jgi:hypothetical protein